MLDRQLYEALATLKEHENRGRGLCVISTKSDGLTDPDVFDKLVERAIHLRKLGYIDFNERQIIRSTSYSGPKYLGFACALNYKGNSALEHGSYEAYMNSQPRSKPLPVFHIDNRLTVHGDIQGSNISSHSNHVQQAASPPNEIDKILDLMVKAIQADRELSSTDRENKIDDIETLRKELLRSAPRPNIIRTVYGEIANTASIASFTSQLFPYLASFLS